MNEGLRGGREPASPRERVALIARALRLEWITVGWMLIEAAVAIGSGIIAHSLTLIAFGADSIIELASACVLIRRLAIEVNQGEAVGAEFERRAARIGSVLLFTLSGYVVVAAAWSLWSGSRRNSRSSDSSWCSSRSR